ncbi:MAG: MoaD/ThiS family protein [Alphaproteobacteria bacterium]|nr:MoaD/ThiS family protein [Alphaproteobacteria bacterium]
MLHIRYFASLRDQMGRTEESLETTASTPKALIAELQARDRQAELLGEPFVRIIINDEIAELESPLSPGDTVAFCPPFSGG